MPATTNTPTVTLQFSVADFDAIKSGLAKLAGGEALVESLRKGMGPGELVARKASGLEYVKRELIGMEFDDPEAPINGGDCVDGVAVIYKTIKDL